MRMPFPCRCALLGAKPFEPFSGKARKLRRWEHGTPGQKTLPHGTLAVRPSVQLPAGIERKRALYGVSTKRQGRGALDPANPAAQAARGSSERLWAIRCRRSESLTASLTPSRISAQFTASLRAVRM